MSDHEKDEKEEKPPKQIEILVNERPVKMIERSTTGREVKLAAISQGVQIQPDFVLSEELSERRSKIVGDDDSVHLHPNQRFIAVAPDDNS